MVCNQSWETWVHWWLAKTWNISILVGVKAADWISARNGTVTLKVCPRAKKRTKHGQTIFSTKYLWGFLKITETNQERYMQGKTLETFLGVSPTGWASKPFRTLWSDHGEGKFGHQNTATGSLCLSCDLRRVLVIQGKHLDFTFFWTPDQIVSFSTLNVL